MSSTGGSAELELLIQEIQGLGLGERFLDPALEPATKAFVTSDKPNEAAVRLSEEALDLILDHVRETGPASAVVVRTFAAVCLVSRTWLESGQRALYRSPLASVQTIYTKKRANQLWKALRNNRTLAGHVRSLVKLAEATLALSRHLKRRVEPEGFRAKSESAFSWECGILKACFRAKDISVAILGGGPGANAAQLAKSALKTLAAVVAPLALVTRLKIKSDGLDFEVSPEMFSEWTASLAKKGWRHSLELLTLVNVDWPDEEPSTTSVPSLALYPRKIVVDGARVSGSNNLRRLVPTTKSKTRFRFFAFATLDEHLETQDLTTLVSLLPSSLLSLSLECTEEDSGECDDDHRELSQYPFDNTFLADRPTPPVVLFSSFPLLRDLNLTGLRDLTPSSLEALAASSPNLRTLLLPCCLWSFPDNDDELDEGALAKVLAVPNWPDLEQVDLGVLPMWEGDAPWKLQAVCDDRGVALLYELCDDEEAEAEFDDSEGYCLDCEGDGCEMCGFGDAGSDDLGEYCWRCGGRSEICSEGCVEDM